MNTISKRIMIAGMFIVLAGAVPRMLPAAESAAGVEEKSPVVLPAGTKIEAQVSDKIDGGERLDGYRFDVYAVNEVRTDGTIVIPAGARMRAMITKNPNPPDHGLVLYSVRLTDVELRGRTYPVVSDTSDITVDPATNSPYPGRVTNTIVPANTVFLFTLKAPLSIKDDGAGD